MNHEPRKAMNRIHIDVAAAIWASVFTSFPDSLMMVHRDRVDLNLNTRVDNQAITVKVIVVTGDDPLHAGGNTNCVSILVKVKGLIYRQGILASAVTAGLLEAAARWSADKERPDTDAK